MTTSTIEKPIHPWEARQNAHGAKPDHPKNCRCITCHCNKLRWLKYGIGA